MTAVRLVRLIEQHSDELTDGLLQKFQTSARTTHLRKVPIQELRSRSHEILRNLSDWLLSKSEAEIERRYREIGALRGRSRCLIGARLLGTFSDQGARLEFSAT